jgi:hypothetical protein
MDEYRVLQQAGTITEPSPDVFIRAENILREYMGGREMSSVPRSRPGLLVVAGVVVMAAAVTILGLVLPVGNGRQPHTIDQVTTPAGSPVRLKAQTVALISSRSSAAVADAGTAVETTTNSINGTAPSTPQTIDVTFSGANVNYLIASNGDGAEGVENRVVDGQFYLYVKGPDLQMHWYHDTSPDAAASASFPDPRTLLQAISPSAQLVNLGTESVGGMELTHLRATSPASIDSAHISHVGTDVTAFDAWVDSHNVVRKMQITSSSGGSVSGSGGILCESARIASGSTPSVPGTAAIPPSERVSTLPGGKPVPAGTICGNVQSNQLSQLSTTLKIQFNDLGAPESVTAPTNPTNQEDLG